MHALRIVQFVYQWQKVGCGFSGTGLCNPQNIFTSLGNWRWSYSFEEVEPNPTISATLSVSTGNYARTGTLTARNMAENGNDQTGGLIAPGVTTGVTFSVPVAGEPPSEWPPTDPTEVTLTYIPGPGEEAVVWTYGGFGSIVRVSTGIYQAELDTTTGAPGTWSVKWVGTGACAAVWIATFPVTEVPF